MTCNQDALRKAVLGVLSADASLTEKISAVHEGMPAQAVYPFVTLGSLDCREWAGLGGRGFQTRLSLHVLSRDGGRGEAVEIQDRIHAALDRVDLPLPDHELIGMRFEMGNVTVERDGRTYHGLMRFIAYTEQLQAA